MGAFDNDTLHLHMREMCIGQRRGEKPCVSVRTTGFDRSRPILTAGAISAAAFQRGVANGAAAHRMVPTLRACGGMADQCAGGVGRTWCQCQCFQQQLALRPRDELDHSMDRLLVGVIRSFLPDKASSCRLQWSCGVVQRDGQYIVRHVELHLPDAADGQRRVVDMGGPLYAAFAALSACGRRLTKLITCMWTKAHDAADAQCPVDV